ncbi:MAG: hypothetical protein Ct9H90mP8_2490 [Pseudomonadota bacterium]|nr:MAG: hypothetical protein Ct9H90mP8_2490 [Pseudomonadota bacterium]
MGFGGFLFSGVLFTYRGIPLIRVLSPLDLYPSFPRFFQHLPLLLNQNRKRGNVSNLETVQLKKDRWYLKPRTSSNGKLNHPFKKRMSDFKKVAWI